MKLAAFTVLLTIPILVVSGGRTTGTSTIAPAATGTTRSLPASSSLESGCIGQLNYVEKNIVDLADAMPDDKFDFTPESLNIPGSAYKGVRTFAGQVKHLATDNYAMWSAITGDPLPPGIKNVNGPDEIKSKADIVNYLKGSFALGHKAIATITTDNALEMISFRGMKMTRLELTFYALTHSQDHFGQMVVYLRMAGIIPPGSRPK
ncbi:MAG TPA: DinB family protein [Bacteroidota bacterium]